MTPRFSISQKKWPQAVKRALSFLTDNPIYGEISDIDFELGPPSGGRSPLSILLDGRKKLLCEPSDTYPFLDSLREWMERCLIVDKEGLLHPEIATIDCIDAVYSLVMVHVGWEGSQEAAEPVSAFIVIQSKKSEPNIFRFCRTTETICRLYRAFVEGIDRNRERFDNPSSWYDVGRFSLMDRRTTSERMMQTLRSESLEKRAYPSKKGGFDGICQ